MERPDHSVPHCRYTKTDDGFKVSFRKMPAIFKATILQTMDNQSRTPQGRNSPGVAFVIGQAVNLIVKLLVAISYWLWLLAFPTRIEVTADTVMVAGKKMARPAFGGFSIVGTQQTLDVTGRTLEEAVTLGYQYGNRTEKFGGPWKQYQANDVVRSLNALIRNPA